MKLNIEQEASIKDIVDFVRDPSTDLKMYVLSGPAGAGKTTIIKHALQKVNEWYETKRALGITVKPRKVQFTASTNKAAETLELSLEGAGFDSVTTFHSFLSLQLRHSQLDYRDFLVSSRPEDKLSDLVLVIDEASYIDFNQLCLILSKMGSNVRILFIGDAAQCKSSGDPNVTDTTRDLIDPDWVWEHYKITSKELPVFNMDIPRTELTIVERSDKDNPIQKTVLALRQMILSGDTSLPNAQVNGKEVHWLPRDEFDKLIIQDMTSPDWAYQTSKVLAYRNKRVQVFNQLVEGVKKEVIQPQEGDYMLNNSYVGATKCTPPISTDRTVLIKHVGEETTMMGIPGWPVRTSRNMEGMVMRSVKGDIEMEPYFLPKDSHDKTRMVEKWRKKLVKLQGQENVNEEEYRKTLNTFEFIKNQWVDFRSMYACTILKSQGSTFRRVFIDLADLAMCRDLDQRNRMLYVAFSRARMQVFLTGNIK